MVSAKQAQRLQTVLRLHDRNAALTSRKWKGCYDFKGVNGGWLSCGCRKLLVDLYANFVSKACNQTNHEKSDASVGLMNSVQGQGLLKSHFWRKFIMKFL